LFEPTGAGAVPFEGFGLSSAGCGWQAGCLSLMMLATTPAGNAYTCAELESISKSAGFARVELAPPEIGLDRCSLRTGELRTETWPFRGLALPGSISHEDS
jgi:hypothetical protein